MRSAALIPKVCVCACSGVSTEAYGLNPYSLRTSSLYDETINMSAIYAEEERVLNSPDKFPAFIAHDFDGEPKGFPVIFSMTLSYATSTSLPRGARSWATCRSRARVCAVVVGGRSRLGGGDARAGVSPPNAISLSMYCLKTLIACVALV